MAGSQASQEVTLCKKKSTQPPPQQSMLLTYWAHLSTILIIHQLGHTFKTQSIPCVQDDKMHHLAKGAAASVKMQDGAADCAALSVLLAFLCCEVFVFGLL